MPKNREFKEIPVYSIFVSKNLRDRVDTSDIEKSIERVGILEPLIVKRKGDKYELIAGLRRLTAARNQGLDKVPAIVVEDQADADLIRLSENIVRSDLTFTEKARAVKEIMEARGWSLKEVAEHLGVSPQSISLWMKSLEIPDETYKKLEQKGLSDTAKSYLVTKVEKEAEVEAKKMGQPEKKEEIFKKKLEQKVEEITSQQTTKEIRTLDIRGATPRVDSEDLEGVRAFLSTGKANLRVERIPLSLNPPCDAIITVRLKAKVKQMKIEGDGYVLEVEKSD